MVHPEWLPMEWRKSSRSTNHDCVEVALAPDRCTVLVRDSTDPEGPWLSVPAGSWAWFVAYARQHNAS